MSDLSQGWQTKKLDQIAEVVNGGTPKTKVEEYWGGSNLWITPAEMGKRNSPFVNQTKRTLSDQGLQNSSASLVPEYSVIMSTRAPIGHLVINTAPMAFNQGCRGMIPGDELDVKYLYYYLLGNIKLLNDLGTGATFKELAAGKLKSISVPYPSIKEQKRIVAILDEAFAGIDTAIANTEQNLANARELFESNLNNTFIQRGEGWKDITVGNLAACRLGKMLDKNKNKGKFKAYLRNINVQWFDVQIDDLLEMRFEENEFEKYQVQKGDLLICEGGYPGRAAIWDKEPPIFYQKALHRVRCNEPKYNRWLLYYLFLSDANGSLKQYFTGAGIQHFTGQALKKVVVPVPPVNRLDDLLGRFENLHEQTNQLVSIYQRKLLSLSDLKQSLLQKAFSGELTSGNKLMDEAVA